MKIVAEGDRLPSGETLDEIAEYALNNHGQVVFKARAEIDNRGPFGVYLVTPKAPEITSVKLKGAGSRTRLLVNGKGFIVNDAVVEIDGESVGPVEYVASRAAGDGTTARLNVSGEALAGMLQPGRTVLITVYNPLLGLRSEPFTFTVPAA